MLFAATGQGGDVVFVLALAAGLLGLVGVVLGVLLHDEAKARKQAQAETLEVRGQLLRTQETLAKREQELKAKTHECARLRPEHERAVLERLRFEEERKQRAAEAAEQERERVRAEDLRRAQARRAWERRPRAWQFGTLPSLSYIHDGRCAPNPHGPSGATEVDLLTGLTREAFEAAWAPGCREADPGGGGDVVDETVLAEIERRVAAFDRNGVGNALLQALMLPSPRLPSPDGTARRIAERIHRWVAQCFDVPETLTYPLEHTDRHLRAEDRGIWAQDTFPQLIVFAYALGATWESLPGTQHQLLPYYRARAIQQKQLIAAVAAARRAETERRMGPSLPQAAVLAILGNDGEDADSKLHALAALVSDRAGPPAARIHGSRGIA